MLDAGVDTAALPRRATLQDVAQASHHSVTTVSRALNHLGGTNRETMAEIRLVAEKLGYESRLSPVWETRSSRNCRIGVMASLGNGDFFKTLQHEATSRHMRLLILPLGSTSEGELNAIGREYENIDGILIDEGHLRNNVLEKLHERFPVVVANRAVKGAICVVPDVENSLRKALIHLQSLGHRDLTYLPGKERSWFAKQCLKTIQVLAQQHNMELCLGDGGFDDTVQGGAVGFTAWKKHCTTAVIAYGTQAACGFQRAAQETKLIIPDDISLLAIGTEPSALVTTPRIATLATNPQGIALEAMKQLFKLIREPRPGREHPIRVPMRFTPRESLAFLL